MVDSLLLQQLKIGLDYQLIHNNLVSPRKIKLFKSSHPEVSLDIEEQVQRIWQEEQVKREKKGLKPMTDSDTIGVDSTRIYADEEELRVPLFDTKFRYLIGTRFNQVPRFRVDFIGAGGISILKADGVNYFLFGKRSPEMAYVGGRVEVVPQGFIKKTDLEKEDPLVENLLREGQEEIYNPVQAQLPRDQSRNRRIDLIVSPYWNNVVAQFVLSLEDTELLKKFQRQSFGKYDLLLPSNPKEHSEFYIVPREELEIFTAEHLEAKSEDEKLGVATRFRLATYFLNKELFN